jgi:hypothetical protein
MATTLLIKPLLQTGLSSRVMIAMILETPSSGHLFLKLESLTCLFGGSWILAFDAELRECLGL